MRIRVLRYGPGSPCSRNDTVTGFWDAIDSFFRICYPTPNSQPVGKFFVTVIRLHFNFETIKPSFNFFLLLYMSLTSALNSSLCIISIFKTSEHHFPKWPLADCSVHGRPHIQALLWKILDFYGDKRFDCVLLWEQNSVNLCIFSWGRIIFPEYRHITLLKRDFTSKLFTKRSQLSVCESETCLHQSLSTRTLETTIPVSNIKPLVLRR